MTVDGLGAGKEFTLYPGGGRAWDWAETGTDHIRGIPPADVEELVAHGATTVVLSRGRQQRLQVDPTTARTLKERGIGVHIAQAGAAVKLYNTLAEAEPVGGLFHSTC